MRDRTIINEVRKIVLTLEGQYEMVAKDLEAAQRVLAMLERELVSDIDTREPRTQAEIVGSAIAEIMSGGRPLHRKEIRDALLANDLYIGNYDNERKQLAALSSILSSDPRFVPFDGKWMLVGRTENADGSVDLAHSMSEAMQQALVSNGE